MGWGSRIREARDALGMAQAELGRRIGKTQQTVDDYEHERSQPKLHIFEKIGEALGKSPVWLAFDDHGPAGPQRLDRVAMQKIIAAIERRIASKLLLKPVPEAKSTMALAIHDLLFLNGPVPPSELDGRIERHLDALTKTQDD